jgi:hypothetical protein
VFSIISRGWSVKDLVRPDAPGATGWWGPDHRGTAKVMIDVDDAARLAETKLAQALPPAGGMCDR